jgi:WD40 repeat protein
MNAVQWVVCLSAAAGLCLGSESSFAEPAPAERRQAEEKVRMLDHQRAPLPDVPPIRFNKVFTLEGTDRRSFGILAFSPDGKILAATRVRFHENPDVCIWDLRKRKLLHVLRHRGDIEHISAIAFVPPGDRLVSAHLHLNKVFLWDVASGKPLGTLDTGGRPDYDVTGLAAFPDGNRVLCCASTGLIVWDLQAWRHYTLPLEENVPYGPGEERVVPRHCSKVAFTADGSRFATTVSSVPFLPRIMLWDAKTCRVTRAIPTGVCNNRLAYAPDGSTVAVTYFDSQIADETANVWDATTGRKLLAGRVYDHAISDLAYTRDGKYLLAAGMHEHWMAGGKGVIGVWEVATGKLVNRVAPASVLSGQRMAVSPDNKLLAVPVAANIDIYAIECTGQSKPGPDAPAATKP